MEDNVEIRLLLGGSECDLHMVGRAVGDVWVEGLIFGREVEFWYDLTDGSVGNT